MKQKLYIDFDGVILDTITPIYSAIEKTDNLLFKRSMAHTSTPEDLIQIDKIIADLDWVELLDNSIVLNDSLHSINLLVESNLFDIAILTHVGSFGEMVAKFSYIHKNINEKIDIICVPKSFNKSVATKSCVGAILIDDHSQNLRKWINDGGIGYKFEKSPRVHKEFTCITSLKDLINIYTI